MYIKFFNNKKGGSAASVDYLLNEREQNGTARTLKGDPNITKQLINSIERKQKVTVGVLSFEESNPLTEQQKHEIIEDFEKTLCPGMSAEQYNILWVEHTDKGRLELNFVIPKIELTTQRALNPYYHKQDFSRIEMFEDICNIKHNLSSKKDPAKSKTLQADTKQINLIKDFQELDKTLLELVAAQQLRSREQLIETLKESGIEVTRAGKDYISVKLPDSKKARKFKGGIYEQQFTSLESLEAISSTAEQRAREFNQRDTRAEYEAIERRLQKYNEQKAQLNREKYQQDNARYTRAEQVEIQLQTPLNGDINNSLDISIRGNDISRLHAENERENSLDSTARDEIHTQSERSKVHQEQSSGVQQRQDNNIHQDRGINNDSTRATIERRARERDSAQQEARDRTKDNERAILADVAEREPKLLAEAREVMRNETNRYEQLTEARERGNVLFRSFESFANKLRGTRDYLDRKLGEFREALSRVRETSAIKEQLKQEPRKPEPDFDEYEYGYGRQM